MTKPNKKNKQLVRLARLHFAEFLRERRMKCELSQMDVAKKLKLKNAQFISNIERGLAPVPFQVLKVLMKVYSISYGELSERYLELQQAVLSAELGVEASGPQRASA